MEVKVKVWIEDENQNLIFGSGKTEVLDFVKETGSIAEASKKVGMNYKKAWNHIKILEKYIEDELVITKKGRGKDSGSRLTPKAIELMDKYRLLEEDVKKYTHKRFNELFMGQNEDIIKTKDNLED